MKNIICIFFILFFSSLNTMQEPFHRPKPQTQLMDETLQPEKVNSEIQTRNTIDCGCLEGCTKFCFWAGAPTCLALIILANKFMRGSSNNYTE